MRTLGQVQCHAGRLLLKPRAMAYATLAILIFLVGCREKSEKSYFIEPDNKSNWAVYVLQLKEYPYISEKWAQFDCRHISRPLSKDLTRDDVKGILGSPDIVDRVYDSNNLLLNTSWYYVFKRHRSDRIDHARDAGLTVYFGPEGRLRLSILKNTEKASCLLVGDINTDGFERYVYY